MKILAIGKNYVNKAEEKQAVKTGKQVIFSKPSSSLVKENQDVVFPAFTQDLRYEVELVIKIGKSGKDISLDDAPAHIEALAVGIDYTAKDILDDCRAGKGPWDLAKGFDGAAPISSFKPIANFPDLNDINFSLKINGEEKQTGNTALMIYNMAEIIAYTSRFMTLEEGDIIFTGTPASGAGQIHQGDQLQAYVEGELWLDFKMV
ncbi:MULTISPECIES: fumarylacetoacetate hydrolase family protein [Persicobacter]|uniref:2-hydroxyhepta-2,4-diene-1,7-dioate isomerase n=1 Tax=Persicobacter diffluens TaxID=981 RepID=A0AAN4VYH7_9BACT|nr:fumarylacetoacetate hydrolase family protein [Persicobacter sp. CCB-QB2]GJM61807.1 2-hydroxyhepta-2,4-diene-1,7-dioate isomerase [Persicobacter diffluens]